MTHRTWVEISERALAHNIAELKRLMDRRSRFCAIVKANAYGHDLKTVSRIAARNGVDAFGVDTVDDALFLRETFKSALVLVLGYALPERFEEVVRGAIHLTVYDEETIRALGNITGKLSLPASIHLKIETGTGRQGVFMEDVDRLLGTIASYPFLKLVGVSTHFANLEDTQEMQYAKDQLARLEEAAATIRARGFEPEFVHSACSAAILLYPQTHDALVRAGIAMYGLWPSDAVEASVQREGTACELRPVLSWKTRIAQVKLFPSGSAIGYGLSERLKRDSRIAVIPVGYFDGYDRGLSSVGEVLVEGTRCRVVGRVCMNMCMIDVSAVPNPRVGQEVMLLGMSGNETVRADDMARWLGTIHYEVVTRIHPHLPRVVV